MQQKSFSHHDISSLTIATNSPIPWQASGSQRIIQQVINWAPLTQTDAVPSALPGIWPLTRLKLDRIVYMWTSVSVRITFYMLLGQSDDRTVRRSSFWAVIPAKQTYRGSASQTILFSKQLFLCHHHHSVLTLLGSQEASVALMTAISCPSYEGFNPAALNLRCCANW